LSRFNLCDSDFGITAVDDITIGITCAAFCFHIAHILFVSYCFGEIMCIWDSCVYQKGVLCFFIHESYVRSVRGYCFVCKCTAVTVQLETVILQYIGWCVLIVWYIVVIIIIIIIKGTPVALRVKVSVCGRSLAGTLGSNPAEGMDTCLL
jgi:hypothetical protein